MELDKNYWQKRYLQNDTPWDIGYVSPPIKEYIDSLTDKELRILIPGAGRAHEAIYLYRLGFQQVFICDWVIGAFDQLLAELPDFPKSHLFCTDFFQLEGNFDLILEQTFFCAISPALRTDYVSKVSQLLFEGGKLAGLLFANPFSKEGPPFGGTESDYRKLFSETFDISRLEAAKNSILPRAQNELFFEFIRK